VTTTTDVGTASAAPLPVPASVGRSRDRRGSWIPTGGMIATRFMELRKRRGLMIALIAVNIGLPSIFLVVRLLSHAIAPKTYGPAGGYDIFTNLVAGVMYIFGFIVAAAVGCTAGSVDLTEGMFRHLVITGRSRLALYLARIPAGLAIVIPIVAVGFTIVCAVCSFAAPTAGPQRTRTKWSATSTTAGRSTSTPPAETVPRAVPMVLPRREGVRPHPQRLRRRFERWHSRWPIRTTSTIDECSWPHRSR